MSQNYVDTYQEYLERFRSMDDASNKPLTVAGHAMAVRWFNRYYDLRFRAGDISGVIRLERLMCL